MTLSTQSALRLLPVSEEVFLKDATFMEMTPDVVTSETVRWKPHEVAVLCSFREHQDLILKRDLSWTAEMCRKSELWNESNWKHHRAMLGQDEKSTTLN